MNMGIMNKIWTYYIRHDVTVTCQSQLRHFTANHKSPSYGLMGFSHTMQ